ncbi:MAG: DUF6691 family protein [Armatimonadota bacterium]
MKTDATNNAGAERLTGLALGLMFGLALHRAGVTSYDVIVSTLLLRDLLVVKVMMTAVVVGAVGVYALRSMGLARLHVIEAGFGKTVIGGLIFGVGFGLLGYCPGTAVGAVAEGRLDALVGGLLGMLVGSFIFAQVRPSVARLSRLGYIGDKTLWEVLRVNPWVVVIPMSTAIIGLLFWIESMGL